MTTGDKIKVVRINPPLWGQCSSRNSLLGYVGFISSEICDDFIQSRGAMVPKMYNFDFCIDNKFAVSKDEIEIVL